MRRSTALAVVLTILGTLVSLGAGFWIKDRCTTHQWDGFQYRSSCYNDIYALYFHRGLREQPVPYIHGDGVLAPDGREVGDLEYPVATGYFIASIARWVDNGQAFFRASAVALGVFALAAAVALVAMAEDRRRIFFFSLAPSLALYAFHNWDLLAVWAVAVAFYAYHRRADGLAGALLGLGAAAKLYPGFLVPVLILARRKESGRWPWAIAGGAVASFVVTNLPILIANPTGWWFPWKFHSTRFPNFETSWYFIFRHLGAGGGRFWSESYPELTSMISGGLFFGLAALLLWREWRRPSFRPYATAFGVMLLFLLTGKVYSPQYALWLLPFFVLVRIPWYGFAGFAITDVLVWAGISAYFLAAPPLSAGDPEFRLSVLEVAVVVRYLVLIWLLWLSRRARENVRPSPADAVEAMPEPEPVG